MAWEVRAGYFTLWLLAAVDATAGGVGSLL